MATQEVKTLQDPAFDETRRRHRRVALTLLGRFMLEDRREFPCQTIDISPGSCSLAASISGELAERVVVYLDQIGRIEGQIVRAFPGGFAMTIATTLRKRSKLAAKLTWLANRQELNLVEDRRSDRQSPSSFYSRVATPDGQLYPCRIVDRSLHGAAVSVEVRPAIGSAVYLGAIRSVVVRHDEDGIAVEFATQQTPESLEDGLSRDA